MSSANENHKSGVLRLSNLANAKFEGLQDEYVDDKTAAAHVAYALSDVSFVHPITLSNYLGEAAVLLAENGIENAFGTVGKVHRQTYREGAAGETEELLASGKIATTYTASQNLPVMVPNMYQIAQNSLPCVFHVAAQSVSNDGTIIEDHSDIMAVRQTGFAILSSHSAKECQDMAVVAHISSLKAKVPFLHFLDGFQFNSDQTSSLVSTDNLLSYDVLARLAAAATSESSNGENSGESASEGSSTPLPSSEELFARPSRKAKARFLATPAVVEAAMEDLANVFRGTTYQLFEYVGSSVAEHLIVVMGSASTVVEQVVHQLVQRSRGGAKVGVLKVRLYRPWSTAHFLKNIPKTVQRVAVLDRTRDPAAMGEPLFQDVVAAFRHSSWLSSAVSGSPPLVINGRYGLDSQTFSVSTVYQVFDRLDATNPEHEFTVEETRVRGLGPHEDGKASGHQAKRAFFPPSPASSSAKTTASGGSSPPGSSTQVALNGSGSPQDSDLAGATPYLTMLSKLFKERLIAVNLMKDKTVWGSNSFFTDMTAKSFKRALEDNIRFDENAEVGFGMLLAVHQRRKRLVSLIQQLLSDYSVPLSTELRTSLSRWLETKDSELQSVEWANRTQFLLEVEKSAHPDLMKVFEERHLLSKPSSWIIGTDQWSTDLGYSGIHHVIASGENVKLVIIDTEPYSADSEVEKQRKKKKDIGLYAMNYGGCYVASVALYDSYAHVLRALKEADEFDGPAVILAYSPALEVSTEAPDRVLFHLEHTQKAVESGYWPLYRWNPRLDDESGDGKKGKKAFSLDSGKLKDELLRFLERGNHLSILSNPTPRLDPALASSVDQRLAQKQEKIRSDALAASFAKLQSALTAGGVSLLILFASDSGKSEGFARRFEEEGKARGCLVRIAEMNAVAPDELVGEKNILFVCSTAGQGEFPANGKEFWHSFVGNSGLNLEGTRFAVFTLGDSNYWPRPDEKHFFCKSGKDLDLKMEEFGAERLLPVGLADDQAADGPETEYDTWRPEFWESLGIGGGDGFAAAKKKTNEDIKVESNFLRGTIAEGLVDESTGALSADDQQLTKFHGIYQQDNRDIRVERKAEGLEPAFSFMIRVRVPGGVTTPEQWLAMDELSDIFANGTLKLTTRQAYQLHGVLKRNLKKTIQGINRTLMDTLAACGDVNRNVMCNVTPEISSVHAEVVELSKKLSAHLSPRTSAYHEIWLDKKQVAGTEDVEPIYGSTYLPRKFKIAIAVPPNNDVDVFTHCLGFIAVVVYGKLIGFNVTIGGGMGMTHGNKQTFPRLADVMAFCTPEQCCDVAEKIVTIQRDWGDRKNRKHARFKYTVEDHGVAAIRAELEKRLGYTLEDAKPFKLNSNGDRFGWTKGAAANGEETWNYTLFVEGGRVIDRPGFPMKTGLKEIAKVHSGDFRLTGNQNLVIGNVKISDKALIDGLLQKFGIANGAHTGLRLNSIACAALPLCALAFAEAERYLPTLIDKLDAVIEDAGLRDDAIVIRMTGCPNGCGRPYLGEIGFVGKAPGMYNLYLGAGHAGERLNKLYKDGLNEEQIIEELTPIIHRYSSERFDGEKFGDFVIRAGYVNACDAAPLVKVRAAGETFHAE